MQKRVTSFDGTKINYDISRHKGDFIVLLHGAGESLTAWKKELTFFHRKGISTLAVDLRGHGKSQRPDSPDSYNLENFAKDLRAVLKKEKISNFVLVGHSLGGIVTIMFHKLYPTSAMAYILVDTTYKGPTKLKKIMDSHPFFVNIVNKILKKENLRNKHFSHVKYDKFAGAGDLNFFRNYSDLAHTSLKSWMFTFEKILNFNGVKILKSIRKPVLIIHGNNDSIFSILVAKKIKNIVTKSKLDIIPNANHIIVINNPKQLEIRILKFISRLKNFSNYSLKYRKP
jgi:pimeloyl-ACP methyl ester carboxylesterase